MGPFRITFERLGRNREVAPLEVEQADGPNDLARQIREHAKPRLVSRDVEVQVDLETGTGVVLAGFRNAGEFTVALVPSEAP